MKTWRAVFVPCLACGVLVRTLVRGRRTTSDRVYQSQLALCAHCGAVVDVFRVGDPMSPKAKRERA